MLSIAHIQSWNLLATWKVIEGGELSIMCAELY